MSAFKSYDVVIIGSGPAGSLCGIECRKKGLSVLCIEKDEFPRFHIGESLTGNAGQIIRDLGLAEEMDAAGFPDKPGVNVIGSLSKNEFFIPILAPTWQVRRSDFDNMLKRKALEHGVEYQQGLVKDVIKHEGKVVGAIYKADDMEHQVRSKVLVDASGQNTFLSRKGVAGKREIEFFSQQIASFAHYKGVERDLPPFSTNTTILYSKQYHWSWIIPISPDTDSLGIVIPKDLYYKECKNPDDAIEWGMENISPEIRRRFQNAERLGDSQSMADFSYRIEPFVGDGWLCIGDAHRFLDPIFSYGVSFAMKEGIRAADAIKQAIDGNEWKTPFYAYRDWSNGGQQIAADLIRYFWIYPIFFGYQMQNPDLRDEVIRLLGGCCFDCEGWKAPTIFRNAIEEYDRKQMVG
ncbi:NAD(P)/FAD-dependent oxidoreductase [Pseudoalteromonas obscura]|uniref:NAD(P)/FAD-dependent oxidoreductase n=1 Tax=Pseudoalteromonas obscura TaxID=3048491 RepID=A0ABT7EK09_9GAMM|nr:NAD(P)/FAD-dependent oxidoreductase [Pseudoalteromonas sp. P94(2023)]MDK2595356.1 NAD(P)/FAD-dependent oxidoreductase [Pseudoalteromonas sp. P94(2023)]